MKTLNDIVIKAKALGKKTRVAVAVAEDSNTLGALARAAKEGFVLPILIGSQERIQSLLKAALMPQNSYQIIDILDQVKATQEAVRMVKSGEADVLMKGLVGTDTFLREVLNKETGLLPPKAVMSYTCEIGRASCRERV